ncbi:MAG: type II and III secretion system protein family protein [Desulfosarcina sp.]|nr:type II and III secretion system protein family protein [Desulfobacterales bacterium]
MLLFFGMGILAGPLAVPCQADTCTDFAESACRIDVAVHKSFLKYTGKAITRVSVADPAIADVQLLTPHQILLVAGQNPGQTNLILWHGDQNAQVYEINVFVPGNLLAFVSQRLEELVPDARIQLYSAPDSIIMNGQVGSVGTLDRIRQIVGSFGLNTTNLITIRGTQQVQLEVKIAEVSRSGMKKMGLGFLNNSKWNIGVFSVGETEGGGLATKDNGVVNQVTESLTTINAPFSDAFQVALHAVNGDTLAILSLLKGQNLARFLANPTLVSMSGQPAEFLVGGEFPIPVQGSEGQTTIEYKEFGIMLRFTPTVLGPDTISLNVASEVSDVDYSLAVRSGGVQVPGLKTRKSATTLQLRDGQSFIMAGLLKETSRQNINKIPFLGDIPILGALFTSKEYQKDESELVVLVTPRLVKALDRDEVPDLPGENARDVVDDVDFFFKNRGIDIPAANGAAEEHLSERSAPEAKGVEASGALPDAGKQTTPTATPSVGLANPPAFVGDIGFNR